MLTFIKKHLARLGPGWITGASDDDPSGIGTYSYSGSRFGLDQIWTMPLTLPLMFTIQEMCARIAQVSGKGIAGVLKMHYSRPVLHTVVFLFVCANTINIAANIGAMAAAMKLLIDFPFIFWALFFTLFTLVLVVAIPYRIYSHYLKFLTVSLFAYVATAFIIKIEWSEVFTHLAFPTITLEKEFLLLLVALFGTTISPYLFFWQSSTEVEEEISKGRVTIKQRRGASAQEMKEMRIDVFLGMVFSNFIALFIMITAASTLFPNGIVIETAQDAAAALKPIAGEFSSLLFAVGIIGTGLLSIPILAGSASYAFGESFGWKTGLNKKYHEARGFYGIIIAATMLGLIINFLGFDPIKMLIWTAIINGFVAPIILTAILGIANNKRIMGRWVNGRLSNLVSWFTVGIMTMAIALTVIFW
ncbi:MAG: Nramp family divalent metal transporter [bacterium]|nr:Nramp family divalent metal transporter [bacterium]